MLRILNKHINLLSTQQLKKSIIFLFSKASITTFITRNLRMVYTIISLCGVVPALTWSKPVKKPHPIPYKLKIFVSTGEKRGFILTLPSSATAWDLYENIGQENFYEIRWNGATLYPDSQTLMSLGFYNGCTAFAEKVGLFVCMLVFFFFICIVGFCLVCLV